MWSQTCSTREKISLDRRRRWAKKLIAFQMILYHIYSDNSPSRLYGGSYVSGLNFSQRKILLSGLHEPGVLVPLHF